MCSTILHPGKALARLVPVPPLRSTPGRVLVSGTETCPITTSAADLSSWISHLTHEVIANLQSRQTCPKVAKFWTGMPRTMSSFRRSSTWHKGYKAGHSNHPLLGLTLFHNCHELSCEVEGVRMSAALCCCCWHALSRVENQSAIEHSQP